MRILIADDDRASRLVLERTLAGWGHDVVVTEDGASALDRLSAPDAPRLAILDWMMPGMDGGEVCRRLRDRGDTPYIYLILLTGRDGKDDVAEGLATGADDYVTKPFHAAELRGRVRAGGRILDLEAALIERMRELRAAGEHVRQLQGLLPICMHCRRIRDDGDTWKKLESYIEQHTGALFSHSLCNDCLAAHYPDVDARMKSRV
ncbi:MAG: response regulator [Acidobacteria bacterium]|nr:response regulator [Acidobacteriota bacterium]